MTLLLDSLAVRNSTGIVTRCPSSVAGTRLSHSGYPRDTGGEPCHVREAGGETLGVILGYLRREETPESTSVEEGLPGKSEKALVRVFLGQEGGCLLRAS